MCGPSASLRDVEGPPSHVFSVGKELGRSTLSFQCLSDKIHLSPFVGGDDRGEGGVACVCTCVSKQRNSKESKGVIGDYPKILMKERVVSFSHTKTQCSTNPKFVYFNFRMS